MKKFIKSKLILQVVVATLVTTLATAGIVIAATTVGNAVSIGSTLDVTGATTLSSTLAVTSGATLSSTLAVTGATTLSATTTISVNGTKALTVKNASGVPIFDVDTTNSRASTTAIIVPQANANTPRFNASSTAVSIGDGKPIAKLMYGTCSVNPASLAVGTSSATSCGATGVASGDTVFVTPPQDSLSTDNWLVFRGASASSTADSIEISLFNASSTANVDGPARTWLWMAIR